jgi:hypothetical protein
MPAGSTNRFADASANADAYVASLFELLGDQDPFAVLADTPARLAGAVAGLTLEQSGTPERHGKWSVRQVVQHLADAEMVGGFRYRMILAHDQPVILGYDQDAWAERLRYDESDLATALGDFSTLRASNLRLLGRLTPVERQRVGLHSERGEESIEKTYRMFAGHDLLHLRQIARIRAAVAHR